MDKNVKRGLAGRVILPDVVWHVFSVVSGGYNKVMGGWRLYSPLFSSSIRLISVADIGDVVVSNNQSTISLFSVEKLDFLCKLDDNTWTVVMVVK